MNDLLEKEDLKIENMIYEIRGKQVMIDSDLAKLYGVETKRINEAVRRNLDKFPERFSFVITEEESKIFLVANCDQKIETRGGKFKSPRVFTEQGVAMLATILKSKVATEISIQIMDAKAKSELIVIDSYADRTFLDMIKSFSFKVILITKINTKLTDLDISKYNSEYRNLTIVHDDTFHDRYFILDKDIIYHCGASINHIGWSKLLNK